MLTRKWLRISVEFVMSRVTKETVKEFAVEALCGFAFWTILLTPYIFPLVCDWKLDKYINWLFMEALLVPPISIVVVNLTNMIISKLSRNTRDFGS